MDCYPRKHNVNVCWLQTSAFHTCRHANAYFTLLNVLVLPGNRLFPCLLTITGSFFGAKYGRLKRILPVCVLLTIIRMWFSGLALAWLHKAASTLKALIAWLSGLDHCAINYHVGQLRHLVMPFTNIFIDWFSLKKSWLQGSQKQIVFVQANFCGSVKTEVSNTVHGNARDMPSGKF